MSQCENVKTRYISPKNFVHFPYNFLSNWMVESDIGNMKRMNAYQGLKKKTCSCCNNDVGLKKNSCMGNNT